MASAILAASAALNPKGFSTNTAFFAATSGRTISSCRFVSEQTTTAVISGSAQMDLISAATDAPTSLARTVALAGTGSHTLLIRMFDRFLMDLIKPGV